MLIPVTKMPNPLEQPCEDFPLFLIIALKPHDKYSLNNIFVSKPGQFVHPSHLHPIWASPAKMGTKVHPFFLLNLDYSVDFKLCSLPCLNCYGKFLFPLHILCHSD